MIELEQPKIFDNTSEKIEFDIVAETTTVVKRISVNKPDSLISLLKEMYEKIEKTESEIKGLKKEVFLLKEEKEDNFVKLYAIKHALEDGEWVEPDELFKF